MSAAFTYTHTFSTNLSATPSRPRNVYNNRYFLNRTRKLHRDRLQENPIVLKINIMFRNFFFVVLPRARKSKSAPLISHKDKFSIRLSEKSTLMGCTDTGYTRSAVRRYQVCVPSRSAEPIKPPSEKIKPPSKSAVNFLGRSA